MAGVEGERWAALESNPTVMTEFCHKAGVPPVWQVVDVWGLDPDLLAFVPQPAVALILLFPTRNKDGSRARELCLVPAEEQPGEEVLFIRQASGAGLENACGTIALLHRYCTSPLSMSSICLFHNFKTFESIPMVLFCNSLLNNRELLGLAGQDCVAERFYTATLGQTGDQRGDSLDKCTEIQVVDDW